MKINPLKDLLVIKLDSHSVAGFDKDGNPIKPQIWHEHKPIGTIITSCAGSDLTEGTRILVNPYAVIEVPDTKEMLIKECDILATIEDEDGQQEEKK